MPLSLDLAHRIPQVLADIRREGKVMTYLRPDAKSQVTIEYDDNGTPVRIDTIVVLHSMMILFSRRMTRKPLS